MTWLDYPGLTTSVRNCPGMGVDYREDWQKDKTRPLFCSSANTGGTLFVDIPYALNAAASGNYNNAPNDYAILGASASLNSSLDNLTDSNATVFAYIELYNQDGTKTKTGTLHLVVDFVAGATGSFFLEGSSSVGAEGFNPPANNPVPLPPAFYLLGSALLGLGRLAWRGRPA